MKTAIARDELRPAIHLIDAECDTLYALALGAEREAATLLLGELDRADVHPAEALPPDTVTMHSRVEFVDKESGTARSVTLVYPGEADITEGKLSVLSHVGAGLIGMRVGRTIDWPGRDGAMHRLHVVGVHRPA